MENNLLEKLLDKSIFKEQLLEKVKHDFKLIPEIVNGMNSSKAAIRYGCWKVLMNLSEKKPKKLYPYFDFFVKILDSKYRILTWQAMAIGNIWLLSMPENQLNKTRCPDELTGKNSVNPWIIPKIT